MGPEATVLTNFDEYKDGEDGILMIVMMVLMAEVRFAELSSKKAPWQAPLPQDRLRRQRGNASSDHDRCHRSSLIRSFPRLLQIYNLTWPLLTCLYIFVIS